MRRYSDASLALQAGIASCAAAEGLLRGMLERLDFSADSLFAAHLGDCREALQLRERGFNHPAVPHLAAATEALERASRTFDSYRYSTDPEHHHLPLFRSEALHLLGIAQEERKAAAREVDRPPR